MTDCIGKRGTIGDTETPRLSVQMAKWRQNPAKFRQLTGMSCMKIEFWGCPGSECSKLPILHVMWSRLFRELFENVSQVMLKITKINKQLFQISGNIRVKTRKFSSKASKTSFNFQVKNLLFCVFCVFSYFFVFSNFKFN